MLYLRAVFHLQLQWATPQMQVQYSSAYVTFHLHLRVQGTFFKPFAGMHLFVFLHVHWQARLGLTLSSQCSRCYSDINNKWFPERNISPGILSQDPNSAQPSGPRILLKDHTGLGISNLAASSTLTPVRITSQPKPSNTSPQPKPH